MKPQAVLRLALPKILQVRLPIPVLSQILRQTLGHKNVPGVPAIHGALRHIDPCSRNVRLIVDIPSLVDWAAVNAHPHLNVWVIF